MSKPLWWSTSGAAMHLFQRRVEEGTGERVKKARALGLDVGHQASPVGTIAAVSTIKITLLSGARVQWNTPFGTVKP